MTTVLCTPLRVEHAALRGAGRSMRLVRTGMGPRRAAATAAVLSSGLSSRTAPVLVGGVGGALAPHIHPGDVVVATEVRCAAPPRRVEVASAPLLAGAVQRLGLTVHLGAISSVSRIGWKPLADGALAVDMESAQLAAAGSPFAVVRVIVDTPAHPLCRLGTLRRGVAALRTLRACQPALEGWAAATGAREILLAAPGVAIIGQVDLVLVLGAARGSDSVRLMRLAQRAGLPAYLVADVSDIDLGALAGRQRLGITAAAAAPPHLVDQIVHCLGGLGPVSRVELRPTEQDVTLARLRETS